MASGTFWVIGGRERKETREDNHHFSAHQSTQCWKEKRNKNKKDDDCHGEKEKERMKGDIYMS
jgi:hypothetical protein